MQKLIETTDLVFLDTETTGLSPDNGDAIIELAAQRVKQGEITGEFQHLINPGVWIHPAAEAVHGISNDQIKIEGRKPEDVYPEFVDFCKDAILIGHNIVRFDMRFIQYHLRQLGMRVLLNSVIDTLPLARKRVELPNYKLGTLAKHYDISYDGAHRALVDVNINRQVFFELMNQ